jgi:hypothetical protein
MLFLPLAYFAGIEGFGFFLPYLLLCFVLGAMLVWTRSKRVSGVAILIEPSPVHPVVSDSINN